MNPTVKEIIKNYLVKNGYDGLRNDECGCGLDDLWSCWNQAVPNCWAAYRKPCTRSTCDNPCICDVEDGDWCYTTEKPEEMRER